MNKEIVKVTWIDAQRLELGVIQDEELPDVQSIEGSIVGFKVHEDKKRIVIAQERWNIGGCKYVHVIPKCSIIKITKLKEVKNGRTRNFRTSSKRNRIKKKTKRK